MNPEPQLFDPCRINMTKVFVWSPHLNFDVDGNCTQDKIYSSVFTAAESKWRMSAYLNGEQDHKRVSVYLSKKSGGPVIAKFQLAIIKEGNVVKESATETHVWPARGHWGYPLISRNKLQSSLHNGTLSVRLTLKVTQQLDPALVHELQAVVQG